MKKLMVVCDKLRAFFENAKQKVYAYECKKLKDDCAPVPDDVAVPEGFVAEVRGDKIVFWPKGLEINYTVPEGYTGFIINGRITFIPNNQKEKIKQYKQYEETCNRQAVDGNESKGVAD